LVYSELRPGETPSEYVQCLRDMAVEGDGDNVLAYTRKWLDLVKRIEVDYFHSMTIHFHFLLK